MEFVSVVKCNSYAYEEVYQGIEQSFNNIGGVSPYFKSGSKVVLKVNLLLAKKPERATTTNPVFVAALAKYLIEKGMHVLIADSPGGPFNELLLQRVYRSTGMVEASKISGAELNYNLNSKTIDFPDGKVVKKITVMECLTDADAVISVAKLKTHVMAKYTGAVKNMFGAIPGLLKVEYHLNMPHIAEFSDMLVDVCQAVNPRLSFIDGIVGMEGDGPSAGNPKFVGAILAGPSPYHLDLAASSIVGINPLDIPTIQRAIERGLSVDNVNKLNLIGEPLATYQAIKFKSPPVGGFDFLNHNKVPYWMQRVILPMLKDKVTFDKKKCISCGDCIANCPPKVIVFDRDGFPVVKEDKCIRCFCCHELCPVEAIKIKRPFLANRVFHKKDYKRIKS